MDVMLHSFKFMHIILNIIEAKIQHVRIFFIEEQNLLLDYPKRLDSWIFKEEKKKLEKKGFHSEYYKRLFEDQNSSK